MVGPGTQRISLRIFELVLVVHLVAQLVGESVVARWTQWLLMPLLALVLVFAARHHAATRTREGIGGTPGTPGTPLPRLVVLILAGLGFSWLGDLLPHFSGEASFLVMVGMFAVAQVIYAVAFWPDRAASLWRSPWALLYLAFAALMVALCLPHAGDLAVPVVGYAVLITVMAVLATGVNRLAAVGAGLFILSDALIAMSAFVPWWSLPGQGFWVMLTYGLAQLLIVLGVLVRVRAR